MYCHRGAVAGVRLISGGQGKRWGWRSLHTHISTLVPYQRPRMPLLVHHDACDLARRFLSTPSESASPHNGNGVNSSSLTGWDGIGLTSELVRLIRDHFGALSEPTDIQAQAIPALLSEVERNAMILAQTGNGKTMAYMIPIIQLLCSQRPPDQEEEEEVVEEENEEYDTDFSTGSVPDPTQPIPSQRPSYHIDQVDTSYFPSAVIVVPNRLLVKQVASASRWLRAVDNDIIFITSSGQSLINWRRVEKNVVNVDAVKGSVDGSERGGTKRKVVFVTTPMSAVEHMKEYGREFFCKVRWCVLDEGDFLCQGNYVKHVSRDVGHKLTVESILQSLPTSSHRVVVAATMPTYGTRSVQSFVHKKFHPYTAIETNHVHKHVDSVSQEFVHVGDVDDKWDKLRKLLSDSGSVNERTLVFANTTGQAEKVKEVVEHWNLPRLTVSIHRGLERDNIDQTLETIHDGSPCVIVATDFAARGIDFVDVQHIIQFDLARDVVSHLHRCGRTARSGKQGRGPPVLLTNLLVPHEEITNRHFASRVQTVTSFYLPSEEDLVKVIRNAAESENSLCNGFSRKRSFRKKLKKENKSEFSGGGRKEMRDGGGRYHQSHSSSRNAIAYNSWGEHKRSRGKPRKSH